MKDTKKKSERSSTRKRRKTSSKNDDATKKKSSNKKSSTTRKRRKISSKKDDANNGFIVKQLKKVKEVDIFEMDTECSSSKIERFESGMHKIYKTLPLFPSLYHS